VRTGAAVSAVSGGRRQRSARVILSAAPSARAPTTAIPTCFSPIATNGAGSRACERRWRRAGIAERGHGTICGAGSFIAGFLCRQEPRVTLPFSWRLRAGQETGRRPARRVYPGRLGYRGAASARACAGSSTVPGEGKRAGEHSTVASVRRGRHAKPIAERAQIILRGKVLLELVRPGV
jgi:hypothetical protein